MRNWVFAVAAAGALFGATSAAQAADGVTVEAAAAVTANRFVWTDIPGVEPVSVVVSIADQRAYVYRGQTLIAVSSVSTGKESKATPAGTYPILQKEEDHNSNLYDAAPMPYMQRLTWDGIALHAGRNPGFPASHGCVRMPAGFAKKLFEVTAVGGTVTVMDEFFVPADGWVPELAPAPEPETAAAEANATQLATLGK